MVIGITGHRPERLGNQLENFTEWIKEELKVLSLEEPNILITGMAKGADQITALAAIELGVPLKCYFPYKHKLSDIEDFIAESAIEVRYEYENYQESCFLDRDRRIVDDCDLLIVCWDGEKTGGTYYTWKYAVEQKKNVLLFPWGRSEIQPHFDRV